jgi:anti-anti-sigma factor
MAANPVVPTPELQLTTEKNPGETVVRSAGRITSSSSGLLQNIVRALIPGTKRIVLDLKDISYIDSSGIGALVSVYMTAARSQCELELVNLQPRIKDLFELTRLTAVFESRGGYRGLSSE